MRSTKPLPVIFPEAHEQAAEDWLSTEGVARFDAHIATPARTLSAEEAGERLRAHMRH